MLISGEIWIVLHLGSNKYTEIQLVLVFVDCICLTSILSRIWVLLVDTELVDIGYHYKIGFCLLNICLDFDCSCYP